MATCLRWFTSLLLIVLVFLGGCTQRPPAVAQWQPEVDSIMVVIQDPRSVRSQRAVSGPGYNPRVQYAEDPVLQRTAARIAADHNVEILAQWPLKSLQVHCFVIAKPSTRVQNALEADGRVRWLQPFNEFSAMAVPDNVKVRQDGALTRPENAIDRLMSEFAEPGQGIRLAVIDTSVDQTHPDLHGSSIVQRNFAGDRGQPNKEAHGTAVVGVIAAQSERLGVRGMAVGADVRVLRGCWQEAQGPGRCNTLTLALALDAAVQLAPDMLNLSLSGARDRVLQELVDLLLARGTIVVAAYDEKRSHHQRFPAPAPGVIYAFGEQQAQNASARPASRELVVVSAPRAALTLAPMAGYDIVTGHSIAAPQISAAVARLLERFPNASRQRIQELLLEWL